MGFKCLDNESYNETVSDNYSDDDNIADFRWTELTKQGKVSQ